jgi:hypothetical protein
MGIKTKITRNLDIELRRPGLTLHVDTQSPGTNMNDAGRNMQAKWSTEGWGHYTLSDDSLQWGTPGKVVRNGAFCSLQELQSVVFLFERGSFDRFAKKGVAA